MARHQPEERVSLRRAAEMCGLSVRTLREMWRHEPLLVKAARRVSAGRSARLFFEVRTFAAWQASHRVAVSEA